MPLLMSDLDDTLVERPPVFRAWAERFLAERGRDDSLLEWMVEADQGGHRSREDFLTELAERTGYDVSVADFLAEYTEGFNGSYRLTDEVRAVIEEVRSAGWLLAVVTNGQTAAQTRKLEVTGLDALVDAVCISEEVGESKPSPVIFHTAARRAGGSLAGAWMIGDNLDADIAGGHGVGAGTVWVKRDYDLLTYTSEVEPDAVVATFPEAVRHVLGIAAS